MWLLRGEDVFKVVGGANLTVKKPTICGPISVPVYSQF